MGTRTTDFVKFLLDRDHPHAYGDKQSAFNFYHIITGSSPRVWGQAETLREDLSLPRIIPTRMGTRFLFAPQALSALDHPHAYGDKRSYVSVRQRIRGSSPRVWGQASSRKNTAAPCGIIPTRMGTSVCKTRTVLIYQDHPHAYGDKMRLIAPNIQSAGSSPRVWGQVTMFYKDNTIMGIIPTRMGTSLKHRRKQFIQQDHPHAYGDKTKEIKENSGFAKSTA